MKSAWHIKTSLGEATIYSSKPIASNAPPIALAQIETSITNLRSQSNFIADERGSHPIVKRDNYIACFANKEVGVKQEGIKGRFKILTKMTYANCDVFFEPSENTLFLIGSSSSHHIEDPTHNCIGERISSLSMSDLRKNNLGVGTKLLTMYNLTNDPVFLHQKNAYSAISNDGMLLSEFRSSPIKESIMERVMGREIRDASTRSKAKLLIEQLMYDEEKRTIPIRNDKMLGSIHYEDIIKLGERVDVREYFQELIREIATRERKSLEAAKNNKLIANANERYFYPEYNRYRTLRFALENVLADKISGKYQGIREEIRYKSMVKDISMVNSNLRDEHDKVIKLDLSPIALSRLGELRDKEILYIDKNVTLDNLNEKMLDGYTQYSLFTDDIINKLKNNQDITRYETYGENGLEKVRSIIREEFGAELDKDEQIEKVLEEKEEGNDDIDQFILRNQMKYEKEEKEKKKNNPEINEEIYYKKQKDGFERVISDLFNPNE